MAFLNKKRIILILILALLFFIGLIGRLYMVCNVHYSNLHLGTEYTHDEYNYINMIKHLFNNKIYSYFGSEPDAYVPPGYPFFLAVIMYFFGTGNDGIFAVKVIQSILSSISIILTYLLSMQLTKKRIPSLIAALVMALSPAIMLYSRFILTETLYIFSILIYFNVQVFAFNKNSYILHILSGLSFAVSIMIRPMIAPIAFIPYLYYIIVNKKTQKKTLKFFPAFLFSIIFVLLPWIIRNFVVLGRFIPLASQSNPLYAGLAEDLSTLPPDPGFLGCIKLLFKQFITNPLETLKWHLYKKFNTIFGWSAYWLPEGTGMFISLNNIIHIFVTAFGFFGLALSLLIKKLRMFGIYILAYILLSLLFVPTSRFNLQYIPFLSIFAGFMVYYCFSKAIQDNKS